MFRGNKWIIENCFGGVLKNGHFATSATPTFDRSDLPMV